MYLAHALLEWHANREPEVAFRVFRLAVHQHPRFLLQAPFVLAFAELVALLKGPQDSRSLYERALGAMSSAAATEALPPPGSAPVWLAYMRFEVLHATCPRDGRRIRELEQRMQQALVVESGGGGPGGSSSAAGGMGLGPGALGGLNGIDPSMSVQQQESLQRLWWRHAPPGLEPGDCASATDLGLYQRWEGLPAWFRSTHTSVAGPNDLANTLGKTQSRPTPSKPLVEGAGAKSAASKLPSLADLGSTLGSESAGDVPPL